MQLLLLLLLLSGKLLSFSYYQGGMKMFSRDDYLAKMADSYSDDDLDDYAEHGHGLDTESADL